MEYKVCPECGERVPARRDFCDACNTRLIGDAVEEKPTAKKPRKKSV